MSLNFYCITIDPHKLLTSIIMSYTIKVTYLKTVKKIIFTHIIVLFEYQEL